eukprot:scaffold80369_cov31-Tisochrysis_lutea.AAC.3
MPKVNVGHGPREAKGRCCSKLDSELDCMLRLPLSGARSPLASQYRKGIPQNAVLPDMAGCKDG